MNPISLRLSSALALAVVCAGFVTPSATAASATPDRSFSPVASGSATSTTATSAQIARTALARVGDIVAAPSAAVARRTTAATTADGTPDGDSDATLAFRDLALNLRSLDRTDRARAASYLNRPAAAKTTCTSVCVHWSASGKNRATRKYVKTVLKTMDHVRSTYKKAGYTYPLGDGKRGGNSKLDVYLRNIGSSGYYGYCTVDKAPSSRSRRAAAYCVLDNNFSRKKFPQHSPVENLRVTAAHEYFHAVQFGYDYREDAWFMEASAAWAEDEVYDGINDNRQYLRNSQLTDPGRPMDEFDGTWHYGQWLFLRFLTEAFPGKRGPLPKLVLQLWKLCGTQKGQPNDYSMKAIRAVIRDHGTTLPAVYSAFVVANRHATTAYSEGSEGSGYPVAPAAATTTVSVGTPSPLSGELDHLSSAAIAAFPTSTGSTVLDIDVSMTAAPGSVAIIDPVGPDGLTIDDPQFPMVVPLDSTGHALVTAVPFTATTIDHVDVDMVNAGTDYTCHRSTAYSCAGDPLDDGQAASVIFTARSA